MWGWSQIVYSKFEHLQKSVESDVIEAGFNSAMIVCLQTSDLDSVLEKCREKVLKHVVCYY